MSGLPRVLDDVRGWYAATTLALGQRTGLLEALLAGGGTAAGLSARAGVDRRIATAWADAMVAAGYAHSADGSYAPDEEAVGPLRGGFPFDMRAVVEFLVAVGPLLPRVEAAFRDGAGIGSDEIQAALGDIPTRVSTPMYRMFLVNDWIGSHPEVKAALRAGADVAEIGPGEGASLRHLGSAFPTSRFVGYDLDAAQVERGNAAAQRDGLANVRLEVAAGPLPADSYDVVCIFDAFHHFTRPGEVLDEIGAALRPGGCLLLAEPALSGDPNVDGAADPTAVITYGCDLVYCLQEGLADGGAGLGATYGGPAFRRLLSDHGFAVEKAHVSPVGYEVLRAVPTR
jgi:SAM-dependent methyltransferase